PGATDMPCNGPGRIDTATLDATVLVPREATTFRPSGKNPAAVAVNNPSVETEPEGTVVCHSTDSPVTGVPELSNAWTDRCTCSPATSSTVAGVITRVDSSTGPVKTEGSSALDGPAVVLVTVTLVGAVSPFGPDASCPPGSVEVSGAGSITGVADGPF